MQAERRRNRGLGLLALLVLLVALCMLDLRSTATAGPNAPPDAAFGARSVAVSAPVRFIKDADSSFDAELRTEDPGRRAWMRAHYFRMLGFHPFFTQHALSWAPPSFFYKDAYAIYNDNKGLPLRPDRTTLEDHPDWALKNRYGNRLFIPFACDGTSCPAFAGSFGRLDFRNYWMAGARDIYSRGYAGIYIDDVNMAWRTSNGRGEFVRPWDPVGHEPMTLATWRRNMASFTTAVRQQFPSAEIIHNAVWFAPRKNPAVRRQIAAADYIQLERGFNDPGITGGRGKYSYRRFLSYIRLVHKLGASVILNPESLSDAGASYELANYFLVRRGNDAIMSKFRSNQSNWWRGWDTYLGASQSHWYRWHGLYRRDYGRGITLVNPPASPSRSVALGHSFHTLNGSSYRQITLRPRSGQILFR